MRTKFSNLLNHASFIGAVIRRFFNFIILGRVKVEIETPQFLGRQDKFHMLRQIGWMNLKTLKFEHDKNCGGKHDVQFHSIDDVHKSIITWY